MANTTARIISSLYILYPKFIYHSFIQFIWQVYSAQNRRESRSKDEGRSPKTVSVNDFQLICVLRFRDADGEDAEKTYFVYVSGFVKAVFRLVSFHFFF